MSTTQLTSAQVMDRVAALMNDIDKDIYTYENQLPYLNMAFDELQEMFQLNNVPVTNITSAIISLAVGDLIINPTVGDPPNTPPNYPEDLIEIQQIWERLGGSSEPYIPVTRRDFLPEFLADSPTSQLTYWAWKGQRIHFLPFNTSREVKLDYIRSLFPTEITAESEIDLINAKSFLQYRTAGLCSQYIGENNERAGELNNFASLAMDRTLGISTKGRQSISTRRRPFLAGYKSRGY